uniref:26S proteasome non-ATPase regulatory subunit 5 n=1 Tax=Steinernema glaseri TaxID=37863 RepID=A0A1I8A1U7_9BILA
MNTGSGMDNPREDETRRTQQAAAMIEQLSQLMVQQDDEVASSPSTPTECSTRTAPTMTTMENRGDEIVASSSPPKPLPRRQENLAKAASGVAPKDVDSLIKELETFIGQSATSYNQAKLASVLEPYRTKLSSADIPNIIHGLIAVILRMDVDDLQTMLRQAAEKEEKRGPVMEVRETIVFEFVKCVQAMEGFKDFFSLLCRELLQTFYQPIPPSVHQFCKIVRCSCYSYLLVVNNSPEGDLKLKRSLMNTLRSVLETHTADLVVPGICYATTILRAHLTDVYVDPNDTFYRDLLRMHIGASPEQAKLLFQLVEAYIGEGITRGLHGLNSEEVAEWAGSLFRELVNGAYSKDLVDRSFTLYHFANDVAKVNIARNVFNSSSGALYHLHEKAHDIELVKRCKFLLAISSRLLVICAAEQNDPTRRISNFFSTDVVKYTKQVWTLALSGPRIAPISDTLPLGSTDEVLYGCRSDAALVTVHSAIN